MYSQSPNTGKQHFIHLAELVDFPVLSKIDALSICLALPQAGAQNNRLP